MTAEDENYVVNSAEPSEIKKSRSGRYVNSIENDCLFCNKEDSKETLKVVMTFKLDVRVRHGAKLLNDFDVLTKIDDSDVVAMEKKYHNRYLCDFYERMSEVTKNQIWKMTMTIVYFCGIVLSEVINHIRKTSETGLADSHPIFLLAELRKLFRLYERYVL